MPQGNPFRTSNRNQQNSNYLTDQNQGGGDKKAGIPFQIGRPASTYKSEAYDYGIRKPLTGQDSRGVPIPFPYVWNPTFGTYPLPNISRPIGSTSRNPYWRLPFGEYGW
jgi:hypothetical protein